MGKWILWILGGFIALAVLLWMIFSAVSFWTAFARELDYIKEEIKRTEGAEQQRWKKRKRRLWRSLLPFVKY